MRLVVTEKPSVARDLAKVLGARAKEQGAFAGDGLRITWCVGHLLELEDPAHYDPAWKRWAFETLPMIPERFALRVREGAADQWRIVRDLLRDRAVREVVNACDAGREGELIFRQVYEQAGCRAPIVRLWISSLTDEAIRDGWSRLRPGGAYEPLADAARCRSEADWIVGLNATRAMTCLARKAGGEQLLSVGRVQTPTLAMIVARDLEIERFVPETFWTVKATFEVPREAGPARWEATWFAEGADEDKESDEVPRPERVADEVTARALAAAVEGREGTLVDARRKTLREPPPLLYDLTSLQRRANQRYGLSADQTLQVAQALYEKHKLITYPRTDARHLTPDQVGELPGLLRALSGLGVYAPFAQALLARPLAPGRRVVNAEEVGDHHAILPTDRTPDPQRLSADERRIYDLVARRLLAALSDDAIFEQTVLVTAVDAGPLPEGIVAPPRFRARGRVCRQAGWRDVDPPGKSRDLDLPWVEVGEVAGVVGTDVAEGQTRPPPAHSDASILRAMETAGKQLDDDELQRALRGAGLGTPATRAAILQTLIQRQFVVREQRWLKATERGRALIAAVPVAELKSAELTGRWEARLSEMAEGREGRPRFMEDVAAHATAICRAIEAADPPPAETVAREPGRVLGKCPVCGTAVREGRGAFSCETGRACAFVVFKSIAKRPISPQMVRQLLEDGRTKVVKGFKSKAGKPFEAGLQLEEGGKVGFWFEPREGRGGDPAPKASAPKAPAEAPADPVGMTCPTCREGRLVRGRAAWGCERWREGCAYKVPFEVGGVTLTPPQAARLVADGAVKIGRRTVRL